MLLHKGKKIVCNEILENLFLQQYRDDLIHVSIKLAKSFLLGHCLYLCGNGGSSGDASHIAGEFVKEFLMKRNTASIMKSFPKDILKGRLQNGLPAYALSDAAIITAIANDLDYSLIFAQQIYVYGNPGDVLILLSTSGNSENMINAAITAREMGIYTICFTGINKNKLIDLCSYSVQIEGEFSAQIQEGYMRFLHSICAIVEKLIYEKDE